MQFYPKWLLSAFPNQQRNLIPGLPLDLDVDPVRPENPSIHAPDKKSLASK